MGNILARKRMDLVQPGKVPLLGGKKGHLDRQIVNPDARLLSDSPETPEQAVDSQVAMGSVIRKRLPWAMALRAVSDPPLGRTISRLIVSLPP